MSKQINNNLNLKKEEDIFDITINKNNNNSSNNVNNNNINNNKSTVIFLN